MNEALAIIGQKELAIGGMGMTSPLFKPKAAFLKLIQKLSHVPGATPGKLRDTSTGQEFSNMRVVLLQAPEQRRKMYKKGAGFTRDAVECFSLDMIKPHDKAKNPQAMFCEKCPKADWTKYQKTRNSDDVPECLPYWHLYLVERSTQMPYLLDVTGVSVTEFRNQMQGPFARVAQMMAANIKAENKKITQENSADPATQKALRPMPNVFDISFEVYVVEPSEGSANQNFSLGFKNFAPVGEDARAEFGQMFIDYVNSRRSGNAQQEEEEAEATAEQVVTAPASAPASQPQPQGVVLPPTGANITGAPVSDIVI